MNWKFVRSHFMKPDGGEDLCLIHDEERNIICSFDKKDISDLEGRMVANAPQMYKAITEFIDKVDHGSLKPKEAYTIFKDIVTRIKD